MLSKTDAHEEKRREKRRNQNARSRIVSLPSLFPSSALPFLALILYEMGGLQELATAAALFRKKTGWQKRKWFPFPLFFGILIPLSHH